jgi:hypothetical protein
VVWLRPGATGSGAVDGALVVKRLEALGIPFGRAVAVDMEGDVNPQYLMGFSATLAAADFRTLVYGQTSTVFSNPPCSGYWAADWTGKAEDYPGPNVVMTQYRSAGGYDVDYVSGPAVALLWDTHAGLAWQQLAAKQLAALVANLRGHGA